MRFTILFLLIGIGVGNATVTYSQSTLLSINLNNKTVREVFDEIEKSSEFVFFYYDNAVNVNRKVSLHVKNQTVDKVLDKLFESTGNTYVIDDRQIFISRNESSAETEDVQQQGWTVSGTIVDKAGETIIGANIIEKGTPSNGIASDANGKFALKVEPNATLVVSYLGYITKEIKLTANQQNLNVVLQEEEQNLTEMVVVGYGTQKKVNLVGSVATLNAKEIESVPVGNLTNALAGRFAGVTVSSIDGGTPGAASDIIIGARGTFNASTAPLYVIDGVIRDKTAFDMLSQSDLETFSVLKDASAVTVYGSRAANGVIMVTTKKGKAGKPTVSYSGSVGVGEFAYGPQMNSMADRIRVAQIGQMEYRGVRPAGTAFDPETGYWRPRYTSVYTNGVDASGGYISQGKSVFSDEALAYYSDPAHQYNALDEVYHTPVTTQHSVNISGGNDVVNYYVGGNYYDESGIFKSLGYTKYSIRANIDMKLTKDLTASLAINTDNSQRQRSTLDNDRMSTTYRYLTLASPLYPTQIDGNYLFLNDDGDDPLRRSYSAAAKANGEYGLKKTTYDNSEYTATLKYDVPWVKGLSAKLQYNRYVRHNFYKDQQKPLTIYDLRRSDPTNTLLAYPDANGNLVPTINEATGKISGDNYVEEYNMYDRFYQFNAQIDYARTFGKHDVSAALIYEQAANNGEDVKARKSDYVVFDRPFFTDFGGTDRTRWGLDGSGWESGRVSYIGRANYTYDSKYLAEFSFRQDLSSKFGPKRKNRAGFFPSAGLAWRMSEEGFIQNGLPWINNLKLRGSIGLTGNDAIDADQWYAKANIGEDGYYTGGAANPSAGTSFGKVPNLLITWEKSLYHNIGLDVGFLNNLFTFSGQYWFKHTYDILGNPISTIPDTFGGEFGDINYGKANSFGLDFELGFNKQINKDLFVYAKGNFGWSGNKLIEYAEGNIQPWLSKIGKNWDRIAGVQADGVIQTMRDTGKTQPKHPNTSAANSPDGMVKLYEITTSTGGKYIIPADYWYTDSSRFIDNGNYNSLRPGWVFYRDLGVRDNGDGTTSGTAGYYDGNATDQTWKIDHLNPPYNYGLLLGANWKGLSLDVFLQGTAGNQKMLFLENQANTYWYGSGFDFWMSDSFSAIDNPTGKYPLIVNAPADTGFGGGSTFWVRDASFLRLKNVTVSYDLPKKILSKSGLSAVRVYVTGNNLALLWNPLKWYDPEMSGGSSRQGEEIATQYETNNPATMYNMPSGAATYPLTRTVTFGLNVSF